MELYQDLQETFIIIFGPFIVGVVLPLFAASGIILAVLMAAQRFWRPLERVLVAWTQRNDTD